MVSMTTLYFSVICGCVKRFLWLGVSVFLLLSGVAMVHTEESGCFTDLDVSKKVLEEALEDCEKRIERAEWLLEQEKGRQTRHMLQLINREIEVLLLNFQSNIGSINALNDEISVIENEAGRLLHQLQTAGSEDSVVSHEQFEEYMDFLEGKKKERDEYIRQQHALVEHLEEYTEEKKSLLAYDSSLDESVWKRMGAYENRAATIRSRIFGLRDGAALSFEQALKYAEQASTATGVRPAFLLGLIRTESRLGHNIGGATYHTAPMHPTRDVPVFPFITETLGYAAEEMPVSQSPGWGWGGAMGPAQFIPSTWVCFGGFVNTKTNTCMPTFGVVRANKRLSIGDTGPDVQRLQEFLNRNGFIIAEDGPSSPGNETDEYTHIVGKAVIAFQNKYSKRILRQYGYTRGTGAVNPATRNAVNQLNFYSGPWEYDASRDIVRKATKSEMPSNPWNPRDAFFASALYLQHLGAVTDECKAARRYYAGEWWESRVALNYCRSVVSSARKFERDITFLKKGDNRR